MPKTRLDMLVVLRGLAASRQQAQALILAGRILVQGQPATKAGAQVDDQSTIERRGDPPRYVSRAGVKLEAALNQFRIPVAGRIGLDVGSSTGGFTDCLLQRGALRVYAIDSGTHQMHEDLRRDPRVRLSENTNARYLTLEQLGEQADLLTVDVSFISLRLLLPALAPLLRTGADAVFLIKPQFEVGRDSVGPGGIVRDRELQLRVVREITRAAGEQGWFPIESMPSPLLGARGNQEYLLYARRQDSFQA